MTRRLAASITDTSGILNITASSAHNTPAASVVFTAANTSLSLGDEIIVNLGYSDDMQQVFRGFVKLVERVAPNNVYTVTAYDELIKATDYFIASNTPDTQYTAMNISAEDLVEDLLAMASITDYTAGTSYFTFGITHEIEVNLISAYDMAKTIADILAWHIWTDSSGTVHFDDRKPYVMDGESATKYITHLPNQLRVSHSRSDRELRNRIVVYGYGDVHAVAEAESPYLPAGFRKSVVVASPWIDYQDIADDAAAWNLEKLNRLTEEVSIEIIGDPSFNARQIVEVSNPYTETSGDWYIFSCDHSWGPSGYTTSMELRK